MEEAAFADGALPKKAKELIAVGISVVVDCESCMQWHIEQAAKAGATKSQVLEAVEVDIEMGGGPATVVLVHGGQTLDERPISPHTPTVQVTNPASPAVWQALPPGMQTTDINTPACTSTSAART